MSNFVNMKWLVFKDMGIIMYALLQHGYIENSMHIQQIWGES